MLREPVSTRTLFTAAVPTQIQGRFQRLHYRLDGSLFLQRTTFSATNYEVRSSRNAFAAGIECERFRPHVMLLDVHLADGDGKGISEVLSESDDLQVTKIIAMSSKLTDGQVAQLRHQGFDGALRKPFTVRQVIEAIEGAQAVVY